ncbi:MAG TPA: Rid family hydrolase [Stellaceae bacterium]|nr:Rid family hydrolase [Stellaceae bacterium]
MAEVEPLSVVRLLGTDILYAPGVRAGNWIFLTGHEAFDFEKGVPAEVAGPVNFPLWGLPRHRREGDFILRRFRDMLAPFGASLATAVRLDQYYPTPEAVDPYHLSRRAYFGDYIPPSTSVVMDRCLGERMSMNVSLLAVLPREDWRIEKVYPADVEAPSWSGFVPAITCNDYVFVAGQMASGGDRALDPEAHVPDYARWGGSEIRKQTEYLITRKLEPALKTAGSSLPLSLKAQVYIEGLEHFPDFIDVWNKYFAKSPCALTVVPTRSFATVGGIIEINLLALKGDARTKKEIIEAGLPAMAAYGPAAVRAGDLLLLSGLMPIDANGSVPGQSLGEDFTALRPRAYRQMRHLLEMAEETCRAAGTSLRNVLRAHQFHRDLGDLGATQHAWQEHCPGLPIPFAAVGIPAPLPVTEADLILDLWVHI